MKLVHCFRDLDDGFNAWVVTGLDVQDFSTGDAYEERFEIVKYMSAKRMIAQLQCADKLKAFAKRFGITTQAYKAPEWPEDALLQGSVGAAATKLGKELPSGTEEQEPGLFLSIEYFRD